MTPLVSVIIPTAGRPQFLPRAVESALSGLAAGQAEVIVVPNGPDESWRRSLSAFESNPDVVVSPTLAANGNAARSHGLRMATGEYVRFLDDDDFLYPDACRDQYQTLETSGADICSGDLEDVDPRGRVFRRLVQPATGDFTEAVLSPGRRTLPLIHVYRRSRIAALEWRESQRFHQDTQWLFDVCIAAERSWIKLNAPVGAWQHHAGQRLSRTPSVHADQQEIARMLQEAVEALETAGRMTPARRAAAAAGLWSCVHLAFYANPTYWLPFARRIMETYPETRPDIGLYRWKAAHGINPILVESIMAPKRWLNHFVRAARTRLGLRHHR